MHNGAAIDEEHRQRTNTLCRAVRRRVAEQTRMRLQYKTTASTLFGRAFRYEDWPASPLLDRQMNDSFLGAPNPINGGTLDSLGFAILAELFGQRLGKKGCLKKPRFGPIIAPRDTGFNRRDSRVEENGQSNR